MNTAEKYSHSNALAPDFQGPQYKQSAIQGMMRHDKTIFRWQNEFLLQINKKDQRKCSQQMVNVMKVCQAGKLNIKI